MKHLVIFIGGLLLMIPVMAAGCTQEAPVPETEAVSFCVSCHTDKDLLKQTAAPVEEETSEATSGEG
jgi:hypothetical protein